VHAFFMRRSEQVESVQGSASSPCTESKGSVRVEPVEGLNQSFLNVPRTMDIKFAQYVPTYRLCFGLKLQQRFRFVSEKSVWRMGVMI